MKMRDNGEIDCFNFYRSFSVFVIALFMLFSIFCSLVMAGGPPNPASPFGDWEDDGSSCADPYSTIQGDDGGRQYSLLVDPIIVDDDQPADDDGNDANEGDNKLIDDEEDEQDYGYNEVTDDYSETANDEGIDVETAVDDEGDDDFDATTIIDVKLIVIKLDGIMCYLIDSNNDGEIDTFNCPDTNVVTGLEKTVDGRFLIDSNADREWNYIYDPISGEIKIYDPALGEIKIISGTKETSKASSSENLLPLYIVVTITTVIVTILSYWIYHDQKRLSCKEDKQ